MGAPKAISKKILCTDRFISPSFNQQGWTNSFDLNSVAYGTSPAYTLHAQHPSGEQYANYLAELAEAANLNVKTRTEVIQVLPVDGVFDVYVRSTCADGVQREETMRARYVVWAAGEFQYPRESSGNLAGAELCVHNSRVRSWAKLPGNDFVVIGGCVIS
jgi:putative flavoprotein involved in K+ transport